MARNQRFRYLKTEDGWQAYADDHVTKLCRLVRCRSLWVVAETCPTPEPWKYPSAIYDDNRCRAVAEYLASRAA